MLHLPFIAGADVDVTDDTAKELPYGNLDGVDANFVA
jgi:hypothetical protein